MEPIDYFASTSFLDLRCPKCQNKIDYGVTTQWDDDSDAHKCMGCGIVLE